MCRSLPGGEDPDARSLLCAETQSCKRSCGNQRACPWLPRSFALGFHTLPELRGRFQACSDFGTCLPRFARTRAVYLLRSFQPRSWILERRKSVRTFLGF